MGRKCQRPVLDRIKRLQREGEQKYKAGSPADSYLENRLVEKVRRELENWRRSKG